MEKSIRFPNSKGKKLYGIISTPSLQEKKAAKDYALKKDMMIILCHGFSQAKNTETNVGLTERLNKNGISTFRFDFFGHGDSTGKFEDITITEGVDDILSAIDLVKNQGYKKIGLVGTSFGGMCSIVAATKSNDLFVLGLKSPVSDYTEVEKMRRTEDELKNWKSKGFVIHKMFTGKMNRLNYSFFEHAKKHDTYKLAKSITVPTLIIHGDKDRNVPVAQSIKLSRFIKNSELQIIEGADHRFGDTRGIVLDALTEFILNHIN